MKKTLESVVFLSMNGRAQKAINFYKQHLDAEVLFFITYEQMAKRTNVIKLTTENKDYVSHSVLKIGQTKLMIAEETMDNTEAYNVGNNTSLCIQGNDLDEIRGFYNSLINDNDVRIIVPLGQNAFSEAYGIIEDPFGIQIQLMYDNRL